MRIIAHGIDIVVLPGFQRLLQDRSGDLAGMCFTAAEIAQAGDGVARVERLAARFAAKEAVLKALGTGWNAGIGWQDIEIHTAAEGAPSVRVYGEVRRVAAETGMSTLLLSLSHAGPIAMASVIAIGAGRAPDPAQ